MKKVLMMVMVLCMSLGFVGCNGKQSKDMVFTNDIHVNKNGNKCLVVGVKEPNDANDVEFEDYLSSILEKNKAAKTLDEIWVLVYPGDVDESKIKDDTMKTLCVCDGLILGENRQNELDFCVKIENDKENKIYKWKSADEPLSVLFSNEKGTIKY